MDSPSRVMTIYGQMNLQDPVMGFGFFFSPRQSIFSPKFAASYVALYRRFEPLATSFVRPRFLDNHTSTPLIFFRNQG